MYAPHTVTVYNVGREDLTFTQPISATVLRGVFYDAAKISNVKTSGLESADEVDLYIPFDVEAFDALTGTPRKYAEPKVYADSADTSLLWTLDTENCFFAKGELLEIGDFSTINKRYDNVHRVTKVDKKDFGTPDMQHWEVGGA